MLTRNQRTHTNMLTLTVESEFEQEFISV